MGNKEITDLRLKVSITDYTKPINDEYGDEYDWYEVFLNDKMDLCKKDRENMLRSLKEYCSSKDTEELLNERIVIYNGDLNIGRVDIYMYDKIKSISEFISLSEAKSGDAGVCACSIVDNGLFKSLVSGRRYAYIEWINLNEEYKCEYNESMVLKKILEFLKLNYNVKRVFSRPIAINLSDDEVIAMRTSYHEVETKYFSKYGRYMVGYVRSYYADAGANIKFLSSLNDEKYDKLFENYAAKRNLIQSAYNSVGMNLISGEEIGVMCAEL